MGSDGSGGSELVSLNCGSSIFGMVVFAVSVSTRGMVEDMKDPTELATLGREEMIASGVKEDIPKELSEESELDVVRKNRKSCNNNASAAASCVLVN